MATLLEQLSLETGMRAHDLRRTLASAPVRYKVYPIPKRAGGTRTISQPAREVKLLQRALISVLLQKLPIHSSATAYRQGLSIVDNARAHAKNGPILKLDFKDFFPSIRGKDWIKYCQDEKCLTDPEEIYLSTQLLFRREPGQRGLRLAIGAPSSPMLSNILMFEFDTRVASAVGRQFVTYTRYADDMTFSAPRTGFLTGVLSIVSKIVREMNSPSLCLNGDKTTYATTKYRRFVTGLTLSNDGRVTIGRERKRKIRAMLHRALRGMLNDTELRVLAGVLAYVNSVEPDFLDTMREKYGPDIVRQVQHAVSLGNKLPYHKAAIASD